MKIRIVLSLTLLLIGASLFPTNVFAEDDHSDTRDGAALLSLNGSRRGEIENLDDVDYFRLEIKEFGVLLVHTTDLEGVYTQLQSRNGTGLTASFEFTPEFKMKRHVNSGTFYIEVSPSRHIGNYEIHTRFYKDEGGAESIYWTEPNRSKIRAADLDGPDLLNVRDIVTRGLSRPEYLALDFRQDKYIYWTDPSTPKIQRVNLDDPDESEDLFTAEDGLNTPSGIVLSYNKVYWTDSDPPKIQRANLDGSDSETLYTAGDGLDEPFMVNLRIN